MSGKKDVPFFDMFPFCGENAGLIADFGGARVISVTVSKEKREMKLTLALVSPVPPVAIKVAEGLIANEFGLAGVAIRPVYDRSDSPPAQSGAGTGGVKKQSGGAVIMGRRPTGSITPMESLSLDLGKATVRGEVFAVSSREIPRRNAWLMSFDITDYTSSIHVSKFMTEPGSDKIVLKIKKGMCLTVSGNLGINRYDNDLTLEPNNIAIAERETRCDTSEEKRVELHLHTKMSALDAVADTAEIIARAIEWGHPAIAITDHGVAHSFPDAMNAAKDKIKVIYGLEGYYYNDVEERLAVYGDIAGTADGEYVVFDIETTGLSATECEIIEIGAVKIKDGAETARFQTFASPSGRIPPEITRLTGITDGDVSGAPGQREAVSAFLEFAGALPLVAHNAMFDVGFIVEACSRHDLQFTPRFIDTVALARAALPGIANHKLDTVAAHYGLPPFNHHRASDDAAVTAEILRRLLGDIKKRGVTDIAQINEFTLGAETARRRGRRRARHIILLARTQAGIKNLYELITKSHLEHFDRNPIIPKSLLLKHREGLIVGSACESGEVFSLVVDMRSSLELRRAAEFYDYLEIQPVCNNAFLMYGENPRAKNEEELREFNRRIVELGKALGKPVVATGDTHFLDPEHEIYRHILLHSRGFDNADSEVPIYFKTTDEMLEEFSYLGEETAREVVITNTRAIADLCEVTRPLPPAKTLYAPKIDRSAEDLKELVYTRLRGLYGDNPPELVIKRVETELADILGRGYDVIYMTAQKLVADSLKHGYLVGSRGSVGSSIVAYLSGITEVNSLPAHYRCPACKRCDFESGAAYGCGADMPDAICPDCGSEYDKAGFDIPFETFLGFGGDKVPDIDLNFSGEYQANAHKYTNELFGADHVFRAGTIGTIAEKTAYGYVKKYLESINKKVTRAEENRLSQGCVGVKRTTGQHPGGLIVIPQDMRITDFCPAQRPADAENSDIVTTHFDYHCMEDNLLKLDELGHDDPTMIKMLEDLTGVDAKAIPLDDAETMAIFKSPAPLGLPDNDPIIGPTGSIGIPEFGTGFTRQMLKDTQPEMFDTLVRLSGFSHGTDVWLGNAKDLILSGTADIKQTIGCRDDIMLYLISLGMDDKLAFKIMESVRKGRGLPDGAEDKMRGIGVPAWYIESCKKIKYLFPKAHAVAYVMMAFRIAWFKVHRPLAFYSAYFYRRSQKDSFDAQSMTRGIDVVRAKITEIRNNPDAKAKEEDLVTTLEACYEFYMRGFTFEPVDLYRSDAVRFIPEGEMSLRPPFIAIGGFGETVARDIAASREGRQFISIDDITAACSKLSKTHVGQLKTLGALGGLPDSSQMTLF